MTFKTVLEIAFVALFVWGYWGRGFLARRRGVPLFAALLEDARTTPSSVTGNYEGVELTVRFVTREKPWAGSRRSLSDAVEISATGLPDDVDLSVSYRSNAYRPGWTPKCETGDPAFDGKFWVDGLPAAWVRDVLCPEVRAAILADTFVVLSVERGRLVYTYFNLPDTKRAVRQLELVRRLRERGVAAVNEVES